MAHDDDYVPSAARRLLAELERHSVPEVLTSEAARDGIENAIKELRYAFQSIANVGNGQVQ